MNFLPQNGNIIPQQDLTCFWARLYAIPTNFQSCHFKVFFYFVKVIPVFNTVSYTL